MQELAGAGRLSRRVAGLKPSGIRKFFDIAATMKDVISLGIGEPDFTTPEPILEAGLRSLQSGETHYTSNHGKLELRQALADQPASASTACDTTRSKRWSSPSASPRRCTSP